MLHFRNWNEPVANIMANYGYKDRQQEFPLAGMIDETEVIGMEDGKKQQDERDDFVERLAYELYESISNLADDRMLAEDEFIADSVHDLIDEWMGDYLSTEERADACGMMYGAVHAGIMIGLKTVLYDRFNPAFDDVTNLLGVYRRYRDRAANHPEAMHGIKQNSRAV